MGQGWRTGRVHTHDKQRDEDHPQAGEEEQAASRPVVRQCCQDLKKEHGVISVKFYSAVRQKFCETSTQNTCYLQKGEKNRVLQHEDHFKDTTRKSLMSNLTLNPLCLVNSS